MSRAIRRWLDRLSVRQDLVGSIGSDLYPGSLMPRGFPGLPPHWESCARWSDLGHHEVIHRRDTTWGNIRQCLCIVHGLGEHGGRYRHFPHYLNAVVDEVRTLDLIGHGRSRGRRGDIPRFDDFADQVAQYLQRLEHELSGGGPYRIHLLGHSLGGLVSLRALLLHPQLPLSSVALSAPLLGINVQIPLSKRLAAQALRLAWGSYPIAAPVTGEGLSHDLEVIRAHQADALRHDQLSARFFFGMMRAMDDMRQRGSEIPSHYPLLFLVPKQDPVVNSESTLKFCQTLKANEVRVIPYDDFRHEAFNEVHKERPFADLTHWLERHGGMKGH